MEKTKSKVSVEETKTKSRGKEGFHSVFNSVLSGDTKSVLFISNPPIIIPRVHFMNSCLTVNDTFSCAVDCFLEISHSVLHPELERFPPTELSSFFQCLVQTCGRYTEVLNGVRSLTELPHIQEFIWCQIRDNCPSFSSKSCDAQFSEIFSAAFFSDLTPIETRLFNTFCMTEGFCSECEQQIFGSTNTVVSYISFIGAQFWWPEILSPLWCNNSLQCHICETVCSDIMIKQYSTAYFRFVEFSPEAYANYTFTTDIFVQDCHYSLYALVCNNSLHFTCAVQCEDHWIYIDDVSNHCTLFNDLEQLFSCYAQGWFFAVYKQSNLQNAIQTTFLTTIV